MIVTEQVAKTKWCPKTIVTLNHQVRNRLNHKESKYPEGTYCIGSECMLWKWVKTHEMGFPNGHELEDNKKQEHVG
jgi:hypothetical protein